MTNHFQSITIKEMCEIMGAEIPALKLALGDIIIDDVCISLDHLKSDHSAYILIRDNINAAIVVKRAVRLGVPVILVEKQRFAACGLNEDKYSVVFLDNLLE